ncbi:MAG TPA: hypothetical protein VFT04_14040 [Gemmatimonadales bacterium]|nr:hypothetical protein [Gemmatimonadales bacterium]
MKRSLLTTALCAAAIACADAPTAQSRFEHDGAFGSAAIESATPSTATIVFGANLHGSAFPPPSGHDASFNAKDNLIPRTVVINRGGSVTFRIDALHQPAVYEPGTGPEDITVSPATLEDANPAPGVVLADFRINDPEGRIALGPAQSFAPQEWTTPPGTFEEPGRYFVICTSTPHFLGAKMYGWVIVR